MLIPTSCYGTYAEVEAKMRGLVRCILRGEDALYLLSIHGFTDTDLVPGDIALSVVRRDEYSLRPSYHAHMPWSILANENYFDQIDSSVRRAILLHAIEQPWSTLGFLANNIETRGLINSNWPTLLHGVALHWDTLAKVGPRYVAYDSPRPDHLWWQCLPVQAALAKCGLSPESISSKTTSEGLLELLRHAGIHRESAPLYVPLREEFKVGEEVRLNSGGPLMTVKEATVFDVLCTWWNQNKQSYEEDRFLPKLLHREAPTTPDAWRTSDDKSAN